MEYFAEQYPDVKFRIVVENEGDDETECVVYNRFYDEDEDDGNE
jgi:hypothetical protein